MTRKRTLGLVALAAVAAAGWALLGPRGESVRSEDLIDGAPPAQATQPPELSARAGARTAGGGAARKGIELVGRALDDRRFPAAGAAVEVLGLGEPRAAGTTDAEGRIRATGFERPAEGWRSVVVRVRDANGRVGIGQTSFLEPTSPDVIDTGTVILEKGATFAVRVVDSGTPVPAAHVALRGDRAWLLEAKTGSDGVARFDALPARASEILAWAPDPPRAGRGFTALGGSRADPVTVTISPARTVEVVLVEMPGSRPVEGATFRVGPRNQVGQGGAYGVGPPRVEPTDAEGKTRIEGTVEGDEFVVQVAGLDGEGFVVVPAGERTARVELRARRVLHFPVVEGAAPVPPDGTVLRLASTYPGGEPPAGSARMEGTTIVIEGATPSAFSADVIAPDDSYSRVFTPEHGPLGLSTAGQGRAAPEPQRPVSFVRPRRVEVLALRPDGSPSEGTPFVIREVALLTPAHLTDASGHAEFTGLRTDGVFGLVLLEDASSPWVGGRVATLDLRERDVQVTVIVPERRSFRARVTVDGRPGLPPRFRVSVDGVAVEQLREDPATGTLDFDARLDLDATGALVTLDAYPLASAQKRVAPVPPVGPIEVDLTLRRPGSLTLPVRAPADADYELVVERWDATNSRWQRASLGNLGFSGPRLNAEGALRLEPLEPGTYRVRDAASGLSSPRIEVRAGENADAPSFDLSLAAWVKGRVLGPDGEGVPTPRVVVEGGDLAAEVGWQGRSEVVGWLVVRSPAPAPGSFRVRVPGDRAVTLRPSDPLLVPAQVGGTVTVTGARDDVVLRLAKGREASVRLVLEGGPPRWTPGPARVLLFRGPASGAADSEHTGVIDGDRLRFGGFSPGVWTTWIDLPMEGTAAVAPAVVSDAALEGDRPDLGTVRFEKGSRVLVRVLVNEGRASVSARALATRLDEPSYQRSNGSSDTICGLGPGRFRIRTWVEREPYASLDEVRVLDGEHDVEVTIDLREPRPTQRIGASRSPR